MPLNEDIEDIFDEIDNDEIPQPVEKEAPEPEKKENPEDFQFQEAPFESSGNEDDILSDLVDDLSENGESEEPEYNTEESFAPSKEVKNTKKIMQMTALIAGTLLLIIAIVIPQIAKKELKKGEETGIVDSDEILKQMREYDERDIKRQKERKPHSKIQEQPLPEIKDNQPQQHGGETKQETRKERGKNLGSGGSRNAQKDAEILAQYAEIDPEAASGGSVSANNKLARLNALPQRQGSGGLNVIGANSEEKKEKASYYNLELKAKLKFGVRSSGGNSVVATISESKGDFPEGTIFYGEATFNNKRTFVNFTHAQTGERKVQLDGRAMTGKDPGLPSEVTEIAGENAGSSLKAGAIGVAGQVADNTLANVTQGATRGVLSESTKDLQKQHEEQKKQYEYFGPAGTVFTIYVY